MQSITTRILPATNTRPTRIKASCERGSLTTSADDTTERGHRAACRMLCERFADADAKEYGSPVASNPWLRPFVTGQTERGDYVHVFTA